MLAAAQRAIEALAAQRASWGINYSAPPVATPIQQVNPDGTPFSAKVTLPGYPNARIASNESRLVPAPKHAQPKGRARNFGRRLLMGDLDYQAAVQQPEIDLIPVRDYDAGAKFLQEEFVTLEQLDQNEVNDAVLSLGGITDDILKYAPYAIGAVAALLLVQHLMSGKTESAPAKV
jgi:hypothetical protein